MPPARFEPTIPAIERTQTHALDRAALGSALYTYRMEYLEGRGGVPQALPRTSIPQIHELCRRMTFKGNEIPMTIGNASRRKGAPL